MSHGRIPSTLPTRAYPRLPISTSPNVPRFFALSRPPGSTRSATSPGSRKAVAPRQVGGQLLAAPEDRLGGAAGCIAFASGCRGWRAHRR